MENPYVLKGNPRFCTQYNNSQTLEGIGPMLSGTASWLALSVFEFLGIEYVEDGMIFNPILPEEMTNVKFSIRRQNSAFDITVTKPASFRRVSDATEYYFDGEKCTSLIPDPKDGKRHKIEIRL